MTTQYPTSFPAGAAQGYGQMPPALAREIQRYEEGFDQLRGEIARLRKEIDDQRAKQDVRLAPRFIEDIPGKRVPYWFLITISVDTAISEGARWTNSATLSQDGPFIIASTRIFWRVTTQSASTDADVHRAFLPPTRLPILIRAATAAPVIDRDIIDWFFAIQLAGGGRNWQNTDIPGATFFTEERPEYLGIPGWIERNDTMTIQATATVSGTAANAPDSAARGTLYIVHSGYKILRPIDYAEAFGIAA